MKTTQMRSAMMGLARTALIVLVLALAGCSGDARLTTSGTICGQPFELAMADRKDRSGFAAEVTCSDGSSIMISSSESEYERGDRGPGRACDPADSAGRDPGALRADAASDL